MTQDEPVRMGAWFRRLWTRFSDWWVGIGPSGQNAALGAIALAGIIVAILLAHGGHDTFAVAPPGNARLAATPTPSKTPTEMVLYNGKDFVLGNMGGHRIYYLEAVCYQLSALYDHHWPPIPAPKYSVLSQEVIDVGRADFFRPPCDRHYLFNKNEPVNDFYMVFSTSQSVDPKQSHLQEVEFVPDPRTKKWWRHITPTSAHILYFDDAAKTIKADLDRINDVATPIPGWSP